MDKQRIRLKTDADADLRAMKRLAGQRLQAKTQTTNEKVGDLAAMVQAMLTSNQAMVTLLSTNQALLSQLLQLQVQSANITAAAADHETQPITEQKDMPKPEPKTLTELNTNRIPN